MSGRLDKRCASCVWWDPHVAEREFVGLSSVVKRTSLCRLSPPRADEDGLGYWPIVHDTDWCAGHTRAWKEEDNNDS